MWGSWWCGRGHIGVVVEVVVVEFVLVQGVALLGAVLPAVVSSDFDESVSREAELALSVADRGLLRARPGGSLVGGSAGHVEG